MLIAESTSLGVVNDGIRRYPGTIPYCIPRKGAQGPAGYHRESFKNEYATQMPMLGMTNY